jgi:molybdopterin/thiamine biosynthesis adenylyltransferase
MIDFDEVSIHNIHRQIAFKMGDEGKNKALINSALIEQRCPFVKAVAHECNFEAWCEKKITVDLIIDATDNLPTRAEIDDYCKSVNLPWVYGSVEAFHGQVCFFQDSSFKDAFKITSKTPEGIAAPIVMHIASLQANLALRYLAGLSVKKEMLYYLFFNADGELMTQKFALPKN